MECVIAPQNWADIGFIIKGFRLLMEITDNKFPILLLKTLTSDYGFANTVINYIKPEYFDQDKQTLFKLCYNYINDYNTCPSIDALEVELENVKITEDDYKKTKKLISIINDLNNKEIKIDQKWLLKQTESYCKRKAYYLASLKVVESIDNSAEQGNAIKDIEEAASFSFDTDIGLMYRSTFARRYDLYTKEEKRIPFGIKELDIVTGGGVFGKTLLLLVAPTGHGKSLVMSSMMANNLRDGLKVACYTFEMGDYRIAERIDANLLNVDISTWRQLGQEKFINKAEDMLDKVKGELFIKEYAAGSAHAGHILANLRELKAKLNFVPDIIYVDYINIMGSKSLKSSSKQDTYIYLTVVAEELRNISQQLDIPIVSACQTNRNGQNSSNIMISDVGDSHGLSKTCDWMISFNRIDNDETMQNKLFFKQLKNRYGSVTNYEKFLIGVDYPRMRIFELTKETQDVILDKEDRNVKTLKKEVGTLTIDDWNSGKYDKAVDDNKLFDNIKF